MKFKSLLLLSVFLLFAQVDTFAQEDKAETDSLISLDKQKAPPRVFPQFFFGWSYINPLGKYGKGKSVEMADGTTEQFRGMKLGFSFELGYIYWLEQLKFPRDNMKFGFRTVYFSPQFIFKNSYDLNQADFNNSFKVGPSFAYNPSGYLILEADLFVGPTLFYNGYWDNLNLLLNYGFQLNARFNPVYIGIGVTFGKYTLENPSLKDRFEVPTTRMEVTFGFNF